MKIARIRAVKFPDRGTEEAAGLDLFIPQIDGNFIKAFEEKNSRTAAFVSGKLVEGQKNPDMQITVLPQSKVMIPSGIKAIIDPGTALVGGNKSGIAWKNSLVLTANIIDSDFRGEIFIAMYNLSKEAVVLTEGQKITQLLHLPIIREEMEEVDEEYIINATSSRGEGALGSTGLH